MEAFDTFVSDPFGVARTLGHASKSKREVRKSEEAVHTGTTGGYIHDLTIEL